jgi:hypothetical protein
MLHRLSGSRQSTDPHGDNTREEPSLSRAFRYAEQLVFDSPFWHLVAAVLLLDLVKNGLGTTAEIADWAKMAKTFPGRASLEQGSNFIQSSPIGPAIAHYLGVGTSGTYAVFSFVMTVVAVMTVVMALKRIGGRTAASVGLVALFASPLSNTFLTWLGKEDPFILASTAVAVLLDEPMLSLLAGFGLAAANPEAGAVIVAICVVLGLCDSRSYVAKAVMIIVGFGMGCGVVVAYDAHIHVAFGGRVTFVRHTGGRELLHQFLAELPTWVFTLFGAYWLSIGSFWQGVVTRRMRAVLFGSALLCAAVTAASTDQTRIFALVSLPLLLWFVARACELVPPATLRRVTTITFIAAVLLPRMVVQAGTVQVSHMASVMPSWL